MSGDVCWCMLVSITCLEHVGVPGVMFGGMPVIFRDNCGAHVCSFRDVSECSILWKLVWIEKSQCFGNAVECKILFI